MHQQIEAKHHEHSMGSFLYKERLQHAQVSQPLDSLATSHHTLEQDIQEDFEMYTVHGNNVRMHVDKNPGTIGVLDTENEPCPSKSATGNRPQLKAQFGMRCDKLTMSRPLFVPVVSFLRAQQCLGRRLYQTSW